MSLTCSTYYYRPHRRAKDEDAVKHRIEAICDEFPRYGYLSSFRVHSTTSPTPFSRKDTMTCYLCYSVICGSLPFLLLIKSTDLKINTDFNFGEGI